MVLYDKVWRDCILQILQSCDELEYDCIKGYVPPFIVYAMFLTGYP